MQQASEVSDRGSLVDSGDTRASSLEKRVNRISKDVKRLITDAGREAALRQAMELITPLLEDPSDEMRVLIRKKVFAKFSQLGLSYQGNDFEVVDYHQYELTKELPMLRGPALPQDVLSSGEYVCVIGASQTFGRLAREPWAEKLGGLLGLPVLNCSQGGAGPEIFLNKDIIAHARGARLVVLQAVSGRTVGCDEYPRGKRVAENGEITRTKMLDVLKMLWKDSPQRAIEYVLRWNQNYLELYRQLRNAISRPTVLLWLSDRRPEDWAPGDLERKLNWGSFPQLIGRELFDSVAALFDDKHEEVLGQSREQTMSRVTGLPCPYFGTGKEFHTEVKYYPTNDDHAKIAAALAPKCDRILEIARQSAKGST